MVGQIFKLWLTILSTFLPIFLISQQNYAENEKMKIHYQVFGSGEPILIINGGPGFNSSGFAPMARNISSLGYQTIIFDQRGTGKSVLSKKDSSTVTMDLMVQDIEAIREQLGYEEWVVLGHSFGGIMVNYYAAVHPERVKAIIASSSGGMDLALLNNAGRAITERLTDVEQDSLNFYRDLMRSGTNLEVARKKHAQFIAPAYVYNKEHVQVVAERLTQGDMDLNRMVWNDLRRINYDTKDKLKDFTKPVLIIQGEEDVVSQELAYTADSVFPESQLVFLKNSSHYGWLDQPRKYYGAIEKFLWKVHEPRNEKERVGRVLKKYVHAIYNCDSMLVHEITDSILQKSGHFYSRQREEWSYSTMRFDQLVETSKTYNKKDWIPQWAPNEIEVFEVKEKTAAARVKAIWGFDYVLLSKTEKGDWKLDKILWQSYTPEEAHNYFGKLKAYSDKNQTQIFDVYTMDEGNLYRGNFSTDGEIFYFFKKTGTGETYRIFESKKSGESWSFPKPLTFGKIKLL